jgi:hypothetical protein
VTHEIIDTVRESQGYYRLSDGRMGDRRAHTEFIFSGDDSPVMNVFTSHCHRCNPVKPRAMIKNRCVKADDGNVYDPIPCITHRFVLI